MVTIYDIAQKTGFSPPTVSKALNDRLNDSEATKAAIWAAADELGYVADDGAKRLITKKSYLVGVIWEDDEMGLGIEHPLFSGIMNAFKRRMEEEGYELLFLTRDLGGRRMSLLDHCRYRGVDAILIVDCITGDREMREIVDSGIPCVSCNLVLPGICCVTSENERPSMQAVRYLRALGHERIAHIAGPDGAPSEGPDGLPSERPDGAGNERLNGFLMGLAAEGLSAASEHIQRTKRWNAEAGYQAMLRLWKAKPLPTALYCAADTMAFGVLRACRELGVRVPEDLSLISFDDNEWASFAHPPLTTFRQDRAEIGARSADFLLALIEGGVAPERELVPVHLVERASCASVRP